MFVLREWSRFLLAAALSLSNAVGCANSSPAGAIDGGAGGGGAGGGEAGSSGGAAGSLGAGAVGPDVGGSISSAGARAGSGGGAGEVGGGGGGQVAGSAGAGGNGGSAGSNPTLQIMPIGDSITVGSSGTNAGYRGPLYNLLKKSVPQLLFVGSSVGGGGITTASDPLPAEQRHNEGHSSYTINDVSNNLDGLDTATFEQYGGADRDPNGGHWLDGIASGANARAALYPNIITMMIGTNNASAVDRTAVQSQLRALITKLTTLRPDTRLIVAQITPSNRPNNVSYNAAVASEVAAFQAAGKHVSVVDMYTNFPADGLSNDGVHPNDKGFAFMSQQWFNAIAAVTDGVKP